MRKQDWSLVLFTTLSQLSIGMVLCLTMLACFSSNSSIFFETGLSLKNPFLMAFILVGIATTISFLHLGKPSNAPRALNNLGGSWLSREILALGLYSVSLLLVLVLGWAQAGFEYIKYLLPLNTLLGLLLLWMMIRIYTVATIPAWNSWYTGLSFISTAICLGLVSILALHHIGFVRAAGQVTDKIALMLAVILLTEVVSGYLNQLRLIKLNTGIENLVFDRGLFYRVFLSRMVLLIFLALAMLMVIYKPGFFSGTDIYLLTLLLITLVFAQEIMGRFLFYSSYFRTGV